MLAKNRYSSVGVSIGVHALLLGSLAMFSRSLGHDQPDVIVETIFDEHQHNSISLIALYHFKNGLTIAYAPGILLSEHEDENEEHLEFEFTQHFEFYYEFELEKFHIGPQFDIGFEDGDIHYMLGLHLGVDF